MLVSFSITGWTEIPIGISFISNTLDTSKDCIKKRYYTLNKKAFLIGFLPELLPSLVFFKEYLSGKTKDIVWAMGDVEYVFDVDFDNIMYSYTLKISENLKVHTEILSKTTDTEIVMNPCTPMMDKIKTWLMENLIADPKAKKLKEGNVLFCDQPKDLMSFIKEDRGQVVVVTNQMSSLEYAMIKKECVFVLGLEEPLSGQSVPNTTPR